jgi:hypothetical protein
MDAPIEETANKTFGELHFLAGNHRHDRGEELIFQWRQRVASIIPESERTAPVPQIRGDRFASVHRTALTKDEKIAAIKAEAVRVLSAQRPTHLGLAVHCALHAGCRRPVVHVLQPSSYLSQVATWILINIRPGSYQLTRP